MDFIVLIAIGLATFLTDTIVNSIKDNVIFHKSIGVCPYLGVSKKMSSAVGMGLAVVLVVLMATLLCRVISDFLLIPLGMEFLNTIVFVLVIASIVQLLDAVLKRFTPTLYSSLGVYLALITTNCAVLYAALFVTGGMIEGYVELLSFALSIGLGFTLALVLMAGVREKLERAEIPASFAGFPIVLLAAGLMAMAFAGFSGLNLAF